MLGLLFDEMMVISEADKTQRGVEPIIIGDYAVAEYMRSDARSDAHGNNRGTPQNTAFRMQFISAILAEDIVKALTKLSRSHPRLTFATFYLPLLDDFQTVKSTIYCDVGGRNECVCDIYNSTEHELIPYRMGQIDGFTVKIGAPFVCLRFLLIEAWRMKVVDKLQAGSAGGNIRRPQPTAGQHPRVRQLLKHACTLRAIAKQWKVEDLFQLDNYDGTYLNEQAERKKMKRAEGGFVPDYYPIIGHANN